MAVLTTDGALHALPRGERVGGGPCALVQRRRGGADVVHGTCILQRRAEVRTTIDVAAEHRLVLSDGRAVTVRIIRHSITDCGPEIVRFEGAGQL